jgi:hypothetical protein
LNENVIGSPKVLKTGEKTCFWYNKENKLQINVIKVLVQPKNSCPFSSKEFYYQWIPKQIER